MGRARDVIGGVRCGRHGQAALGQTAPKLAVRRHRSNLDHGKNALFGQEIRGLLLPWFMMSAEVHMRLTRLLGAALGSAILFLAASSAASAYDSWRYRERDHSRHD